MLQQETGEVKLSEDGSVEFETPTDDEEITIPSQDRNREVPDIPDFDIRHELTLENTQREDCLLPTEPMHSPESESDLPFVAQTADFDGRRGIHTAEGWGGGASGP